MFSSNASDFYVGRNLITTYQYYPEAQPGTALHVIKSRANVLALDELESVKSILSSGEKMIEAKESFLSNIKGVKYKIYLMIARLEAFSKEVIDTM
jgi:hypothetical protein